MDYRVLSKEFYKDRKHYDKLYDERFHSEFTLHIPITINGNEAFMTYTPELFNIVAGIYNSNTRLREITFNLPRIALEQFTRKCLIGEILLTNEIEGVYSTRKEIGELLTQTEKSENYKRLYGLVRKYDMLSGRQPLKMSSCADIRSIYDELVLPEVLAEDEHNAPDGTIFRKDSVSVQGKDLRVIHYGVTPEENIITDMNECLRLVWDTTIDPLIITALVHYFIGYIHPFYDGNGRLNRFISSYLLTERLNLLVGYNLSYTIKKQMDSYYKAFKIVNDKKNKGDVTPFIIIFLNFVKEAMADLNNTLSSKIEEMEYYNNRIKQFVINERHRDVLFFLLQNTLFGEKGLFVDDLARIAGVSVSAMRNYISAINEDMLEVSRDGNRKCYNMNLDYFA